MPEITVNETEPAHAWIQKLADEAAADELIPEEYDFYQARRVVLRVAERFEQAREDSDLALRYDTLRTDTTLSDREAEVVVLKELGLSHTAIATYYGILGEGTESDEQYPRSPSTVDEYSRRAREKYQKAQTTIDELKGTYGG